MAQTTLPGALGNALRSRARQEAEALIEQARLEFSAGHIDQSTWSARVTDALADLYLMDRDPRWQSGFEGDAELWRQARELILEAVDRDGTFLDIGCATGHLMECLTQWATERRRVLTVSGLELSPDLLRVGRERLPAFALRMHHGDALTWTPPVRFTYVRTGLEYAPKPYQPAFLTRLYEEFLEPRGRLIVGPVTTAEVHAAAATFAAARLPSPAAGMAPDRNGKTRYVLWIEKA